MKAAEIPIGTCFGSYTVTGPPVSIACNRYWPCECVCGTRRTVKGGNLRSGRSNSCGCQAGERISQAHASRAGRPRKNAPRKLRLPIVLPSRTVKFEVVTPEPTVLLGVVAPASAPEPVVRILTPALQLALAMRKSGARWREILDVTGLTREEVEG